MHGRLSSCRREQKVWMMKSQDTGERSDYRNPEEESEFVKALSACEGSLAAEDNQKTRTIRSFKCALRATSGMRLKVSGKQSLCRDQIQVKSPSNPSTATAEYDLNIFTSTHSTNSSTAALLMRNTPMYLWILHSLQTHFTEGFLQDVQSVFV